MDGVIYFSCTGNGEKVANLLAEKIKFPLFELTNRSYEKILNDVYGTAVIVFPVHCQSFPKFLNRLFKKIKAENVALIATYGKINAGNALYEAAKRVRANIVAAAYLPAGHSYLRAGVDEINIPAELTDKILNPTPVTVPRRKKTPFAGVLPNFRSRVILKIYASGKCAGCNLCGDICPYNAIIRGKTNNRCTRCLKCVASCPHGALSFKKYRILSRYLDKHRADETILYVK